ncbi:hypothetical protein AB0J74_22995 [Asanoa sp. NPDC049573]
MAPVRVRSKKRKGDDGNDFLGWLLLIVVIIAAISALVPQLGR